MDEKISKEEIIKALHTNRQQLGRIITNLSSLDGLVGQDERDLVIRITYTLFELMDSIGNTEVDIYNYMKRRGES